MVHSIEHPHLDGPAGRLETHLMMPQHVRNACALVCHPDPLAGGTLHTKAVHHTARALVELGLPVLRFNFRGVGRSAGTHTRGPGERQDAGAALDWLVRRFPGVPILAGGFSFGAWVGLEVGGASSDVGALVGIAPPLTHYDFEFLAETRQPILCVAGDRDVFCPAPDLEKLGRRLGPRCRVDILAGAEHLLTTHKVELRTAVRAFTEDWLRSTLGELG